MPDATVTITPGTGVNVDVSQITRPDGTIVERQRMVLGDDRGNLLDLNHSALPVASEDLAVLMKAMLIRLDLLCHLMNKHYAPPDELGL